MFSITAPEIVQTNHLDKVYTEEEAKVCVLHIYYIGVTEHAQTLVPVTIPHGLYVITHDVNNYNIKS